MIEQFLNNVNNVKKNIDNVNELFKNFIKYMVYLFALTFVYKYTLYYWLLTGVFVVGNIYVLWKLHWKGIEKLVKYNYLYFIITCFISTGGILLLKLNYDSIINLSILFGRDEQEYLMSLVLFNLPLSYYGSKVSVIYSNTNCEWVE